MLDVPEEVHYQLTRFPIDLESDPSSLSNPIDSINFWMSSGLSNSTIIIPPVHFRLDPVILLDGSQISKLPIVFDVHLVHGFTRSPSYSNPNTVLWFLRFYGFEVLWFSWFFNGGMRFWGLFPFQPHQNRISLIIP